MKGSPETSCKICGIDGLWTHQAVNLEGLIKGGFWADEKKPNPLWSFDDLRQLVQRGKKLEQGEIHQLDEDSVDIKGALALIDYFSDPTNVEAVLEYYSLNNYTFLKPSTAPFNADGFVNVDQHPLPKALARQFQTLVQRVRSETGQVLSLASGYRSPAYQLYLMCAGSYRRQMSGEAPSLNREFRIIAPPYCSQHSDPVNTALDIAEFFPNLDVSVAGASSCEAVRDSTAWQVFSQLACEIGFKENYPVGTINNGQGEPWEWQKKH